MHIRWLRLVPALLISLSLLSVKAEGPGECLPSASTAVGAR